jgi:hypothetical protein
LLAVSPPPGSIPHRSCGEAIDVVGLAKSFSLVSKMDSSNSKRKDLPIPFPGSYGRKHGLLSCLLPCGVIGIAVFIGLLIFVPLTFTPPGKGKMYGNEASACCSLAGLAIPQKQFHRERGTYGSIDELNAWYEKETERFWKETGKKWFLLEPTSPEKPYNGYYFILTAGKDNWLCIALPAKPGESGSYSFYVDKTDVVRRAPFLSESDKPAGRKSNPCSIEQDYPNP